MGAEDLLLFDFLKNPALLALLFVIIRNIGGYLTACFKAKKLVAYEPSQLGETLTLYETFFIGLSQIPNMPITWIAGLTVLVDILRSFKEAVKLVSP